VPLVLKVVVLWNQIEWDGLNRDHLNNIRWRGQHWLQVGLALADKSTSDFRFTELEISDNTVLGLFHTRLFYKLRSLPGRACSIVNWFNYTDDSVAIRPTTDDISTDFDSTATTFPVTSSEPVTSGSQCHACWEAIDHCEVCKLNFSSVCTGNVLLLWDVLTSCFKIGLHIILSCMYYQTLVCERPL